MSVQNNISLIGRLTADPEITYLQSGSAVATFSLAVDRQLSKQDIDSGKQKTDFFKCTIFGKQAEFVGRYIKKGYKVAVTGELRVDIVKKGNVNEYYTKILCNGLLNLTSREETQGGAQQQGQPQQKKSTPQRTKNVQPSQENAFDDDFANDFRMIEDDEDIPF